MDIIYSSLLVAGVFCLFISVIYTLWGQAQEKRRKIRQESHCRYMETIDIYTHPTARLPMTKETMEDPAIQILQRAFPEGITSLSQMDEEDEWQFMTEDEE